MSPDSPPATDEDASADADSDSEAIPAEAIRDLTSPMELAVSPDGDRVAFVATEYDASEDEQYTSLFTVPTDGGEDPHRLTRVSDGSAPAWSPDGSKLAFLGARETDRERAIRGEDEEDDETDAADDDAVEDAVEDADDDAVEDGEAADAGGGDDEDDEPANGPGEEEPKPQVWVFDLARGGDARQVTDREWGVREFDWGPEGERIVIAAKDPTEEQEEYLEQRQEDGPIEVERRQHKVNGVGFTNDVTTYLFVVDVETGAERRLEEATLAGAMGEISGMQPAWHPDDEVIAYTTCLAELPDETAESDVVLVDVESGEITPLTDGGVTYSQPRWSPDGTRLTFGGRDAANWYLPADVYVTEPDPAAPVEALTDHLGGTLSWFGAPRFLDDETIVCAVGSQGLDYLHRLDVEDGAVDRLSLGTGEDRSIALVDAAGGTVAYSVMGPNAGHDLWAVGREAFYEDDDVGDDAATRLTDLNEDLLAAHPMPELTWMETTHERRTEDGPVTVETLVYHPDSFDPEDPEPHPTVVWTHGGPMSYDTPAFDVTLAYYTSRGYLVAKPNYRGSTSYGPEFADTLNGRWGTVEVADVLAVTEDLVARGWADEDRLFATGFSYGGIMTGYLITQSDVYTAAAPEHGIYDLRGDFGTGDSQVWQTNEFGRPWENPEVYEAHSAITDVEGVTTPTLVTAGGQDWRCPPTQAEQLYVSLRRQGVPAKLVIYPEEHHEVRKPERAIHRMETVLSWFREHDPAVEGAGETDGEA